MVRFLKVNVSDSNSRLIQTRADRTSIVVIPIKPLMSIETAKKIDSAIKIFLGSTIRSAIAWKLGPTPAFSSFAGAGLRGVNFMGGTTTVLLKDWIADIKEGDDSAFEGLIAHFQKRLEALARKMLKGFPIVIGKDQTEDVLQEALLHFPTAFRKLVQEGGTLNETKTFHGADLVRFAAELIRRELIDLAKKYRRRLKNLPPAEALNRGNIWNPASLAEWTEFHQIAASFPDEIRDVFDRIYYKGMTRMEAAKELGVSERTVRSRYQKARLAITTAFGGRMPESGP
jgi:RNA polymerase sigma factor (sigma-70 family)